MKLGITMPTRTMELAQVPRYAELADQAGFDSVWDWELYRNPFSMLATSALRTQRAMLGTGLAVASSRSPFEMANAAADIDELTNGRMLLGIGSGVAEFVGAFHSNELDKPLTRMSEYVDVLRLSWQYLRTGEASDYDGQFYQFFAPLVNPWGQRNIVRERIPIYLGAVGPKMLQMVGRKADGWLGYLGQPEYLRERVLPLIAKGATEAGRDMSEIDLTLLPICVIHPDREVAMERARKQVGFYVSHPTSDPMVEFAGLKDEVDKLRIDMLTDGLGALEKASDELVHAFSVTGTPDEVRAKLTQWDGIVDHLVLHTPYVPPFTAEESEDCFRNIVETFTRSS